LGRLEDIEDKIWIILTKYRNGMADAVTTLNNISEAMKEVEDKNEGFNSLSEKSKGVLYSE
jgi:hypothetical protein